VLVLLYVEPGGFTKGSLQKVLDLSIVYFRVFYLTTNTSLPGNMLFGVEGYVKNYFFRTFLSIRTDILNHLYSFTDEDCETFYATFSKGGALLLH
jgi:hypothetical protein